jgi:uncharacterized flavoprotein (TIGR03862 family)
MILKPAQNRQVLIVGSGPAALMAAEVLSSRADIKVRIIEKRRSPGRKLLIAGSSGLNITNRLPVGEFARAYSGSAPAGFWHSLLEEFSPADWIAYIEKELGQETFLGTSGRYFVREMKASKLLRAWLHRLAARGVELLGGEELLDFDSEGVVTRAQGRILADAVLLALGGASYEPEEMPLRWVDIFRKKDLRIEDFKPSNAGHEVAWSEAFLKEAEGRPLKNIVLTTSRGSKRGELVVTRYGLEGTPVYTVGLPGEAELDLLPEFTFEQALSRCNSLRENLSPIRRVFKKLPLGDAAKALVFHQLRPEDRSDLGMLISRLKCFPIQFTGVRPLTESISSSGGVSFETLDPGSLELRKVPRVYCAGEMLDWDAPTGGFLIQGSVSTGYRSGKAILKTLV